MRYVKVSTDGSGGSTLEDVDVAQAASPFADNVPALLVSDPLRASEVVFVTTSDDSAESLPHPTPRRQFVVMLEGEIDLRTTDGQTRRFGPGSICLLEDLSGVGHFSTVRGGRPATFMAVALPD